MKLEPLNKNPRVLAIIPARQGSKRVLKKNLRNFAGKPLFMWTLESALVCELIDLVVVSTDDDEILKLCGSNSRIRAVRRSPQSSSDVASSAEVVTEVLNEFPNFEIVVLLQPTSPLRTVLHITKAVELCIQSESAVASVSEVNNQVFWSFQLGEDGELKSLFPKMLTKRSQDLPDIYAVNGAIYALKTEEFLRYRSFIGGKTLPFVMTSQDSIDIDTEEDFVGAENRFLSRQNLCDG